MQCMSSRFRVAFNTVVSAIGETDFPRRREPHLAAVTRRNWVPAFAGMTTNNPAANPFSRCDALELGSRFRGNDD